MHLTGLAKASDIRGWGGLWLRVDGPKGVTALDNMQARPIQGTTDWTTYELVLDVDPSATRLAYGSLLAGEGQLWFDPPKLDVVAPSVEVSGFDAFEAAHTSGLRQSWFVAGTARQDYDARADLAVRHDGVPSLFLASKVSSSEEQGPSGSQSGSPRFGTAMQWLAAGPHKGSRVRLTAYVKTVDVASWAGLWMRVDGPSGMLAFDNMQTRPITGTTDWARYAVTLDVPASARGIALGVLLEGKGKVWVDDVVLEDLPPEGS
jgi:hypothetical protein